MIVTQSVNGIEVEYSFNNELNPSNKIYSEIGSFKIGSYDFIYLLFYIEKEHKCLDRYVDFKNISKSEFMDKMFNCISSSCEYFDIIIKSYEEIKSSDDKEFNAKSWCYDRQFEKYLEYLNESNFYSYSQWIEDKCQGDYDRNYDVRTFIYPSKIWSFVGDTKSEVRFKAEDILKLLNSTDE